MKSLLILERDSLIPENAAGALTSASEWIPQPGALEAIARLSQAGYRIVVMAHNHAMTKGQIHIDTITAIHQKLRRILAQLGGHIEAVFFCREIAGSPCSQPYSQTFAELAQRLRLTLSHIPAIGYSAPFLHAAKQSGARVMQLSSDTDALSRPIIAHTEVFDQLQSIADWLLDIENV